MNELSSGGSNPAIRRHSERPGGPRAIGRMRTGNSEFRTYIKLCVMVSSRFVKGPAGPMLLPVTRPTGSPRSSPQAAHRPQSDRSGRAPAGCPGRDTPRLPPCARNAVATPQWWDKSSWRFLNQSHRRSSAVFPITQPGDIRNVRAHPAIRAPTPTDPCGRRPTRRPPSRSPRARAPRRAASSAASFRPSAHRRR